MSELIPRERRILAPGAVHVPGWLADLGRWAIADAYLDTGRAKDYLPDVALIDYYEPDARHPAWAAG